MIKDKVIAQRYADAYIGFVRETIGQDAAIQELKDLKNVVIRENPGFMEFLGHESIGYNEKYEFVEKVLDGNFSQELRNFLKFLVEKGRINYLGDIMEYIRINYSYGQEIEALLKTSFPLDVELIKEIEDKLESKLQKKFKFYIDLDADLMGGIQVIFGNNTIIDGSVRKRLADLKEKLRGVRV
ncbi:MAG: ATP synthase F1 subunit delta [Candidatus Omnitrophica bacterium]|nr:ATP synthase F1 subunit delta [Candidatus Omnitrophota bacterium]